MSEQGPIEKLVNAILLSSWKKQATVIVLRYDERGAVIEFDDAEEMRPPAKLVPPMLLRLAELCEVPLRNHGELTTGRFALTFRHGTLRFDVEIEGLAESVRATLRRIPSASN